MNTKENKDFPVNEQGENAFLVVNTGGVDYPFWRIMDGWGGAVADRSYLVMHVDDEPGVVKVAGHKANWVLYTDRELTYDEWFHVVGQMHFNGHSSVVIRVNWNTGSEFEFESVLNPNGKHCLTYQGNMSQGVVKQ